MGDFQRRKIINHMKLTVFYTCILFFFAGHTLVSAQISKAEKQALTDLYNSTTGDEWTNSWNFNDQPESWHGVTISDNKVVEVNLNKNNLQGAIPASIGDLKHIEVLNLGFNKLTGELPIEVVKLKELKVLRLEMNRLKGSIPKTMGQLANLKELVLFNNMIEGQIPSNIGGFW